MHMLKKKKSRGGNIMNDILKTFVDKDCIIYTVDGQISGNITAVEDNYVSIIENDNRAVVNTDYIIRVREYPLNKKGKRKSIV